MNYYSNIDVQYLGSQNDMLEKFFESEQISLQLMEQPHCNKIYMTQGHEERALTLKTYHYCSKAAPMNMWPIYF